MSRAGRYAPVPGDPFRFLAPPRVSANRARFRELFPHGVPIRDSALTDAQRAFLASGRPFS